MPTDHNFYKQRWKAAGVRFNLSYGMFDDDKLVGFVINAIDERKGHVTAYNAGTGVIPEYRGKRIVKSIYEHAIPDLVKNGITKCQLEVITENKKAIKAYEGIGFKIGKHYKCFKGEIGSNSQFDFILKEVSKTDLKFESLLNQHLYSWDNQFESLVKGNYQYYQVLIDDKLQAYFIMNSENCYVAQLEVLEDSISKWQLLFSAIKSVNRDIRINNIDDKFYSKIETVKSTGLENTVDQFEMELFL